MKKLDLIRKLSALDLRGVYVFHKRDVEKMFPEETAASLEKSLKRMVGDGLLARAAKGIYINPAAISKSSRIIEDIARLMRPGHHSYVSLESMLAEYGVISQMPLDRLTVMTSGKSGVYQTPFGTIEFTHTKRGLADILARSIGVEGRPLRVATKAGAIEDLRRVGRNLNMLQDDELLHEASEVEQ